MRRRPRCSPSPTWTTPTRPRGRPRSSSVRDSGGGAVHIEDPTAGAGLEPDRRLRGDGGAHRPRQLGVRAGSVLLHEPRAEEPADAVAEVAGTEGGHVEADVGGGVAARGRTRP